MKGTCRLLVFSGRVDPEWHPEESMVQKIIDYCDSMPAYDSEFEIPEVLGYHGVEFFTSDLKVTAYKGKMEIKTVDTITIKNDLGRKLEQMILLDSPPEFRSIAMDQLTIDFD